MGLEVFERGALPQWVRVRQQLYAVEIDDVAAAVAREFQRPAARAAIVPGARVALTGGSRGIDRIDQVLAAAVTEVRRLGGDPFIVPAMGSHGGATAEGQLAVLAHYGVTSATMGCPIRASMETVHLGEVLDGVPVWFDKIAATEADVVIPVGRVKPHTDFRGPVESGLMKMIAIGLGKQHGANTFHGHGFDEFYRLIPAVANFSLRKINMPFGLALVENGFSRLALIEAVPAGGLQEREQELLDLARQWLARIPAETIDVLVVDALGKDISGSGADPNVTNRSLAAPPLPAPVIQRMIVRDLTPDTEGNATGLGVADVILQRVADKFDSVSTYMNCVTAKSPEGARLPLAVANDRQALYVALACCLRVESATSRIARIQDTKHLEEFWATEPLLPQLLDGGRVTVLGEPRPIVFDASGMFVD